MIKYLRTNSENPDFQNLIRELDAYLATVNGTENSFFTQFNKTNSIQHVVVAYERDIPIGCGAIKEYDAATMEIKRMFIPAEKRGQGIATNILKELERWALELNYKRCILETAETTTEAVNLYAKNGYHKTPNYGQYKDIITSVCFEKTLV